MSDDHATVIRMVDPIKAADLLSHHLGEDREYWLHFYATTATLAWTIVIVSCRLTHMKATTGMQWR